jgi:hypothetical protein
MGAFSLHDRLMKNITTIILLLTFYSVSCFAEVTYKVIEKEEVIETQKTETKITYYVDVYINKNLVAENVEVDDLSKVKEICQQFLTAWNAGREIKITAKDITDIKVEVKSK